MKNNISEIIKILAKYLDAFPKGDEITSNGLFLRAEALQDFHPESVEKVLRDNLTKWDWFPTAAQIAKTLKPSLKVEANNSFERILEAVQRFGSNNPNVTLNEVEKVALRSIGGFSRVGMASEEQTQWIRKDYTDFFEQYSNDPETRQKQLTQAESKKFLDELDLNMP